jgi:hypothetical protein
MSKSTRISVEQSDTEKQKLAVPPLYIERPPITCTTRILPIARRTGTFVPLPTPTRGRRMPARKSPEGRRGQPAWQHPSTTSTHFTRGRLTSAAFLFGQALSYKTAIGTRSTDGFAGLSAINAMPMTTSTADPTRNPAF